MTWHLEFEGFRIVALVMLGAQVVLSGLVHVGGVVFPLTVGDVVVVGAALAVVLESDTQSSFMAFF